MHIVMLTNRKICDINASVHLQMWYDATFILKVRSKFTHDSSWPLFYTHQYLFSVRSQYYRHHVPSLLCLVFYPCYLPLSILEFMVLLTPIAESRGMIFCFVYVYPCKVKCHYCALPYITSLALMQNIWIICRVFFFFFTEKKPSPLLSLHSLFCSYRIFGLHAWWLRINVLKG